MGPSLYDELALMREREVRRHVAHIQHQAAAEAARRNSRSDRYVRVRVAAGRRLIRAGNRLAGAP